MIRSEFPDVEIPDARLTDFVLARAGELGDKLVEEIPKSPSGKILRRLLIDRERAVTASG